MGKIAIVVNPNSGKDIRRLTTHAAVCNDSEKINIIRRVLAVIAAFGGQEKHEVFINPDRGALGRRALNGLAGAVDGLSAVIPDYRITDSQEDTTLFVKDMAHRENVDVIIVLGGDGTCRAAAKEIGNVPLITLSTGTNNVYPEKNEGTMAGMAAVAIASGVVRRKECGAAGKRIEIRVLRGEGLLLREDIALVDAVISPKSYVGARALLDERDVLAALVTQAHPASVGFSALAGAVRLVRPGDEHGLFIRLDWDKRDYRAAFSTGVITYFGISEKKTVKIGEVFLYEALSHGTIAVDGEREIPFRENDQIEFMITRRGPLKADVLRIAELALERGFFKSAVY